MQPRVKNSLSQLFEEPAAKPKHEAEDFSWAVSYADLLMVLLSFFVIFFNVKKIRIEMPPAALAAQNILSPFNVSPKRQLLIPMQPKDVVLPLDQADSKALLARAQLVEKGDGISCDAFADNKIECQMLTDESSAEIRLSDNIFESAQFQPSQKAKTQLKNALLLLKNVKKPVQIVVIGHADSARLERSSSEVVNNNMTLATLRAAYALPLILASAPPNSVVFAQGNSDLTRNSRTLSLVISPLVQKKGR
jgi:flagellar motor protein MotB